MDLKHFRVKPGTKVKLKNYNPDFTGKYTKSDAKKKLKQDKKKLRRLQNCLYSESNRGVVIIIQGLDASGKDGTIEAVFEDVNPNGYTVVSYKAPSLEELEHDFLQRHIKDLPRRGRILVSNRSWYEEVLAVKVHPEFLEKQRLPKELKIRGIWKRRFNDINNFECYLTHNGTVVIKIFLHVSRKVQARRLRDRMDKPSKRWKFSLSDTKEGQFYPKYMKAIQAMLSNTSTKYSPWNVIPADHKWFARAATAHIIVKRLEALKLGYPELSRQQRQDMRLAKKLLKKTIKGK